MKNKIISLLVLIALVFSIFVLNYKVEAYSGEIDPENYIFMPKSMYIENKTAKCTISLSSKVNEYDIYYQKIDINESVFNQLVEKNNQINNYSNEQNSIIKEKENKVKELLNEYQKLQSSGTATDEEIKEAENAYNKEYEDFQKFINTVNTEISRLKSEYYNLIPNYTNSWQATTNSTNNVELNFQNYSGTANYVLWAKITNGTNTYYDVGIYSTSLNENDNNGGSENTEGTTDFSNAKFNLVKKGVSDAIIEVDGVTPIKGNDYYVYISDNANEPDLSQISEEEKILLYYNEENGKLNSINKEVARKVELNQDLYVAVVEHDISEATERIVSFGTKLTRYDEPKYNEAFFSTFIDHNSVQIITTYTHSEENNRKMQIKIGKITDFSILQKIRNEDESGFSKLMDFAKSNEGIYNETLDADKDDSYAIEYNADLTNKTENELIKLSGLEDEAYYYLYVKTLDENGKYISNEAVTLANASSFENGEWYLYFYGASDFNWVDWNVSNGEDTTTAPGKLPQTGLNYIIVVPIIFAGILVILARIKYKKYNF